MEGSEKLNLKKLKHLLFAYHVAMYVWSVVAIDFGVGFYQEVSMDNKF